MGLFIASPWIMLNNAFGGRPFRLTLIDGGYATLGCGLIGIVLTLFQAGKSAGSADDRPGIPWRRDSFLTKRAFGLCGLSALVNQEGPDHNVRTLLPPHVLPQHHTCL